MPLRIADWLVFFVALVQASILIGEMLFWKKPFVHESLGFNAQEAAKVAPIVANQGLYNGFLAAGLIWGQLASADSTPIKLFFLTCVILAGIFGAVTVDWKTLPVQTLPAAVALLSVWMT